MIHFPHLQIENKVSFEKFNVRCFGAITIRGFMEHGEGFLVTMTLENTWDNYW